MTGTDLRLKMIAVLIAVALICPSASFAADMEYQTSPYKLPYELRKEHPELPYGGKRLLMMNASTDPNKPFGVFMERYPDKHFYAEAYCISRMPGRDVEACLVGQFQFNLAELKFETNSLPAIIVDKDKVFTSWLPEREKITGIGYVGDFILIESGSDGLDVKKYLRLYRVNGSDVALVDKLGVWGRENDDMIMRGSESKTMFCRSREGGDDPVILNIADFDNDGKPELKVYIDYCEWLNSYWESPTFVLFLEITDSGLKVDFNPELYKPVYEKAKKGKNIDWFRCITGYYAEAISYEELPKCAGIPLFPLNLLNLIKERGALNSLMHEIEREKLIKYDISRGRNK